MVSDRARRAGIKPNSRGQLGGTEQLAALAGLIVEDVSSVQVAGSAEIEAFVGSWLRNNGLHLDEPTEHELANRVRRRTFGYGFLSDYIDDPAITDIWINRFDEVWIERAGIKQRTPDKFRSDADFWTLLDRLAADCGFNLGRDEPVIDGRLPNGGPRLTLTLPPTTPNSPSLSLRKYSAELLTLKELLSRGALSNDMAVYLISAVGAGLNIVVSGGTGTGKTTLLSALLAFVAMEERIITIEDTREIRLRAGANAVALEARGEGMTERMAELLRRSLRMAPDRLIVGEVRGPEAAIMLQAMNTGHDGSMCSVHANSPEDALSRLETLVLMSRLELPYEAIRAQLGSAVHLLVQLSRLPDGRRLISEISEVVLDEHNSIHVRPIFVYVDEADTFEWTEYLPSHWRRQARFLPQGKRDPFGVYED